jgi:hypothetical protein
MTREEKITALTALWYEFVNLDHHKDRDCHWMITKLWSYGAPPVYCVEHNGYVEQEVQREFKTETEAEDFLYSLLQIFLKKNLTAVLKDSLDPDWLSEKEHEVAERLLSELKMLADK